MNTSRSGLPRPGWVTTTPCKLINFLHRVLHVLRGQPSWIIDEHDLILTAIGRRLSEFCEHNDCAGHDDGGLVRLARASAAQDSAPDSLTFGSLRLSFRE